MNDRRRDADAFYDELQAEISNADERNVQRQALAGSIWSKQFFHYDVPSWLAGDPGQPPPPPERRHGRNRDWTHLNNADIISMPDKWEYPWYAAWDLAFHCIPLALVDAEFAKQQLVLLTREWYMHPNGQLAGVRVGVWRRESAGARMGHVARLPDGSRKAPAHQPGRSRRSRLPRARVPQADAQFHLVGEPEGSPRGATSFRAASWGSTISASSIAARRCRPAGSSTSPTAPVGWPCIRST